LISHRGEDEGVQIVFGVGGVGVGRLFMGGGKDSLLGGSEDGFAPR